MESTPPKRSSGKRPGGRTAEVTARVHQAVLQLLVERGIEHCTFKSVADRAGIDRSTLYRRYPDRWEMIIDAFIAFGASEVMPSLGSSFADDLMTVLRRLAGQLDTPLGTALIATAAALRQSSDRDYSRTFFDRRMAQLGPMFDAAIARGELPADVDREALFTFAAGAVYFRMFIAARRVDEEFIQSVVSSVRWLYCTPSATAKLSRPACIA